MAHELTFEELKDFQESFNNARNKVVARAAMKSGLLEASFNPELGDKLNHVFSIEVDTENVTNQVVAGYFLH